MPILEPPRVPNTPLGWGHLETMPGSPGCTSFSPRAELEGRGSGSSESRTLPPPASTPHLLPLFFSRLPPNSQADWDARCSSPPQLTPSVRGQARAEDQVVWPQQLPAKNSPGVSSQAPPNIACRPCPSPLQPQARMGQEERAWQSKREGRTSYQASGAGGLRGLLGRARPLPRGPPGYTGLPGTATWTAHVPRETALGSLQSPSSRVAPPIPGPHCPLSLHTLTGQTVAASRKVAKSPLKSVSLSHLRAQEEQHTFPDTPFLGQRRGELLHRVLVPHQPRENESRGLGARAQAAGTESSSRQSWAWLGGHTVGGGCRVERQGWAPQNSVLEQVSVGGRDSEQTPEGSQEDGGQGQGPGDGKASAVTEVVLAAGRGGGVLGVAVVHGLKAAGHARLAHLHPGRRVVCTGELG